MALVIQHLNAQKLALKVTLLANPGGSPTLINQSQLSEMNPLWISNLKLGNCLNRKDEITTEINPGTGSEFGLVLLTPRGLFPFASAPCSNSINKCITQSMINAVVLHSEYLPQ